MCDPSGERTGRSESLGHRTIKWPGLETNERAAWICGTFICNFFPTVIGRTLLYSPADMTHGAGEKGSTDWMTACVCPQSSQPQFCQVLASCDFDIKTINLAMCLMPICLESTRLKKGWLGRFVVRESLLLHFTQLWEVSLSLTDRALGLRLPLHHWNHSYMAPLLSLLCVA